MVRLVIWDAIVPIMTSPLCDTQSDILLSYKHDIWYSDNLAFNEYII